MFCKGSLKDKTTSISILYEELGIQSINSFEMAKVFEGIFKLYSHFDPKLSEKLRVSDVSEIALNLVYKCWNDFKIGNITPFTCTQVNAWIEKHGLIDYDENNVECVMSKYKMKNKIAKGIKVELNKLIYCNTLCDIVDVNT